MPIIFVTSRRDKLEEAQQCIDIPLIAKDVELTEIQSMNVAEIVRHKTEQAFQMIKQPLIVDDISLSLNAYSGFPGPFIKFLLSAGGGNSLLLKMLEQEKNRDASVTCTIGYHDGHDIHIFSGVTKGTIGHREAGTNGWGFDSVFIPEDADITYAQMTDEQKAKVSFRARALSLLKSHLQAHTAVV